MNADSGIPDPNSVREALRILAARLAAAGDGEAARKAELLVGRALGVAPLAVHARTREPLPAGAWRALEPRAARAAAGEPLQYILGDTEFRGRVFRCDRRALIPRPETEELVQAVLDDRALWASPAPALAEVGTGTGCIVLSLAAERPQGRYLATDTSVGALDLARENARALGLEGAVEFRQADLLAGIPDGALDAVVSNPPYVATADLARLDRGVRDFEPRGALDGGPDGMSVLRRLAAEARRTLRPGGCLFLETAFDQGPQVVAYLRTEFWDEPTVKKDLSGHDRIVTARRGAG